MIKIKAKIENKKEMTAIANMISEFYGLDVVVDEADFNPYPRRADLKIVTPSGKIIAKFHMSLYRGEEHWSLGGQTFVLGDDIGTLSKKMIEAIKEDK